jgi:CubicO group peptidase (beta-lactamase class C family)
VIEEVAQQVGELLRQGLTARPHPIFPGAVCAVEHAGRLEIVSCGSAYRYADLAGTLLPPTVAQPMTADTVFDLASLTKLFTATVVMRLVELERLALDEPVGDYLPSYCGGDRSRVTIRQLLTHTSGLPAEIFFWRDFPDVASRRQAVLEQPLEAEPGTRHRYSCVGYITLGLLMEDLLGQPLDHIVDELVCRPLGLTQTGYRPLSGLSPKEADTAKRAIAATEMRPITWTRRHDAADPDPRGVVHDENAASLDGVSGNAGLFAPVRDLVTFGRVLLDGLSTDSAPTGGRRRELSTPLGLSAAGVRELVRPQLPPGIDPGYQSGLGFRIDDPSFMGTLVGSQRAYGHTGFTGTSIVLDEQRDVVLVLCTNRVHPNRTWSEMGTLRRRLAGLVAQAAWP